MKTYTQSDLNAALVAMVEACAAECDRHAKFCKYELDHGGNAEHLSARYAEANYLAQRLREMALPADIVASEERERKAEIVVVTNVVIESLQEEITKLREAISPGRVGRSTDYYCAVARKMREMETVIRPMESSDAIERQSAVNFQDGIVDFIERANLTEKPVGNIAVALTNRIKRELDAAESTRDAAIAEANRAWAIVRRLDEEHKF